MAQGIYYHEYALKSRRELGAQSARRSHRGVLLRIGDGFGCVHPWPELGDAPVEAQLEALRRAEPTALIARAYRCAGLDGLARREGRSLFAGLEIPESHALVTGSIEEAVKEGFGAIKLKCGREVAVEAERVHEIAARLQRTAVRLRLDFNECLEGESFRGFCEDVGPEMMARVDFIEDPFPYAGEAWEAVQRSCGVRLAVDRAVGEASGGGYGVAIVKPARDEVEAVLERETGAGREVVFTSYLDHPVGQFYAAYEAAVARRDLGERVGVCGLATHRCFEENEFIERVKCEGPRLAVPEGTGIGFDDLLESIPWKHLK